MGAEDALLQVEPFVYRAEHPSRPHQQDRPDAVRWRREHGDVVQRLRRAPKTVRASFSRWGALQACKYQVWLSTAFRLRPRFQHPEFRRNDYCSQFITHFARLWSDSPYDQPTDQFKAEGLRRTPLYADDWSGDAAWEEEDLRVAEVVARRVTRAFLDDKRISLVRCGELPGARLSRYFVDSVGQFRHEWMTPHPDEVAVEVKFSLRDGHVLVNTALDAVVRDSARRLGVLDFKGSDSYQPDPNRIREHDAQVSIYAVVAEACTRQAFPGLWHYRYLLREPQKPERVIHKQETKTRAAQYRASTKPVYSTFELWSAATAEYGTPADEIPEARDKMAAYFKTITWQALETLITPRDVRETLYLDMVADFEDARWWLTPDTPARRTFRPGVPGSPCSSLVRPGLACPYRTACIADLEGRSVPNKLYRIREKNEHG